MEIHWKPKALKQTDYFVAVDVFIYFFSGAVTFTRCIAHFGKCVFLSSIFTGLAHNALLYSIIYMKHNLTTNKNKLLLSSIRKHNMSHRVKGLAGS